MSELGDLLELLHGARNRWRTVQASVHRWTDAAVAYEAWQRHVDESRGRGGVAVAMTDDGEELTPGLAADPIVRVWIDWPGRRSREESEDRLHVRVGDTWWHWAPDEGSVSNEGEPSVGSGGHDLEEELDPAPLIGLADLHPGDTVTIDGRGGRHVTVTPRPYPDERHGHFSLHGFGATDFAWVVDEERGILLRVEARFEGQSYSVTELHDIVFDEALPDDLFIFVPPDGGPIESPGARMGRMRTVPIEQAGARATFTVLVPGRLPEGGVLTARVMEGGRMPPAIWVDVGTSDRLHHIHIHQAAVPMADALDWEDVEHRGVPLRVCDGASRLIVKGELLGTHFRLEGDLDRETMLEMAASLRAAPTAPPRLTDNPPAL